MCKISEKPTIRWYVSRFKTEGNWGIHGQMRALRSCRHIMVSFMISSTHGKRENDTHTRSCKRCKQAHEQPPVHEQGMRTCAELEEKVMLLQRGKNSARRTTL